MVDQRASRVRAAAWRSSALSLANSCSIGLRSASTAAGRGARRRLRRWPRGRLDPVRGQVVKHHNVAGRERRRQELVDAGADGGARHQAVEHSGTTMPLCLSPAMKVVSSNARAARRRPDAHPTGSGPLRRARTGQDRKIRRRTSPLPQGLNSIPPADRPPIQRGCRWSVCALACYIFWILEQLSWPAMDWKCRFAARE